MKIEIFKKQNERLDPNAAQNVKPFTNLYVHGLEPSTKVEQVKEMFSVCGEIESCSLKNDREGIAFVCYKRQEDAAKAV